MMLTACGDRTGTYAGARRHQNAGQELCESCRQARNDYRAKRYAENPVSRDAKAVRTQAHVRATARLRDLHPAEFQALYRQALAEVWQQADGIT